MGDNFCLLTTLKDAVVFVQLLWERQSTINDISVWRIQKKQQQKPTKVVAMQILANYVMETEKNINLF